MDPALVIGSLVSAALGASLYFVVSKFTFLVRERDLVEGNTVDEYAPVRDNLLVFSEQNVHIDTDYFSNCPVVINGRVDRHTFEFYARNTVLFEVSREFGGEIDNDAYVVEVEYGENQRLPDANYPAEFDYMNYMRKPYPGWMTPEQALWILAICVGKFREMKGAVNEG